MQVFSLYFILLTNYCLILYIETTGCVYEENVSSLPYKLANKQFQFQTSRDKLFACIHSKLWTGRFIPSRQEQALYKTENKGSAALLPCDFDLEEIFCKICGVRKESSYCLLFLPCHSEMSKKLFSF